MTIDFEAIAYAAGLALLMATGAFLFFSKDYIPNSTKRQRELGRESMARYQETRFYFYFVKTLGLLLMFGTGWLFYIFFQVMFGGAKSGH